MRGDLANLEVTGLGDRRRAPSEMKRIAVIADHPQRDLDGLVLLGTEIARRGAECALIPLRLQFREVMSLQPDVVLVNYLRRHNQESVRLYTSLGIRVALLDSEGGILRSIEEYGRILTQDPDVRAGLARFLTWGTELAAHAVRVGWFRADQVAVTGHPRFDFYAAPLSGAVERDLRAEFGLQHDVVLVNSGFTLANARFLSPDQEAAFLKGQGHVDGELSERRDVEARAMEGLVTLTRELAGRFPRVSFVYRPHPFENPDTYRTSFEGIANVRVLCDGPVAPWIQVSRAVVQRGCTTAVEASLCGVPALEPVWLPCIKDIPLISQLSVPCSGTEELVGAVDAALTGGARPARTFDVAAVQELEKWFYRIDGHAHERVAEELVALAEATPGPAPAGRFENALWGAGRCDVRLAQRISRAAKRAVGRVPDLSDGYVQGALHPWESSPRAFSAQQVAALSERVARCRPRNEDGVDVLQAAPNAAYRGPHGSGFSVVIRRRRSAGNEETGGGSGVSAPTQGDGGWGAGQA